MLAAVDKGWWLSDCSKKTKYNDDGITNHGVGNSSNFSLQQATKVVAKKWPLCISFQYS